MKILGIDPGTQFCGYGVIDSDLNTIDYGLINVTDIEEFWDRIELVCDKILEVINKHKDIDVVVIENFVLGRNVKTASKMCELRGALIYIARKENKKVFNYHPKTIKKTVTGSGKADKDKIKNKVEEILKLNLGNIEDDVSDGLAIALTYILRYKEGYKDEIEWKEPKDNKPKQKRRTKQNKKKRRRTFKESDFFNGEDRGGTV